MRVLAMWLCMLGMVALGAVLEGSHLSVFIQPSAFIIVFGPVLSYLIFSQGVGGAFLLVQRALQQKIESRDVTILDRLAAIGYLSGGLAAILGIIHVMGNLSDSSKLGAGIAVAFVGTLYGTIPAFLLTTLSVRRPKRLRQGNAQAYMAAAVLFLLFSFFTVLYAISRAPTIPGT